MRRLSNSSYVICSNTHVTPEQIQLTSAELHPTRQHPLPRPLPILQRLHRSATVRLRRHRKIPARVYRRPLRGLHPQPSSFGLLPDSPRLVRGSQRAEQPLQPGNQQSTQQRACWELRRRSARRAIPVFLETAGRWRTCIHGEYGEEGR
jgi:hypothetical protein